MLYINGTLSIETALPGDFNYDGIVDAADYVVWRDGLGVYYSQGGYDVWRASFGRTVGGASGASPFNASVPEPATNLILLACTLMLPLCRLILDQSIST